MVKLMITIPDKIYKDIKNGNYRKDVNEITTEDKIALSISTGKIINDTSNRPIAQWVKHKNVHGVYFNCSLCACSAPYTEFADGRVYKLSKFCPDCGANNNKTTEYFMVKDDGSEELIR